MTGPGERPPEPLAPRPAPEGPTPQPAAPSAAPSAAPEAKKPEEGGDKNMQELKKFVGDLAPEFEGFVKAWMDFWKVFGEKFGVDAMGMLHGGMTMVMVEKAVIEKMDFKTLNEQERMKLKVMQDRFSAKKATNGEWMYNALNIELPKTKEGGKAKIDNTFYEQGLLVQLKQSGFVYKHMGKAIFEGVVKADPSSKQKLFHLNDPVFYKDNEGYKGGFIKSYDSKAETITLVTNGGENKVIHQNALFTAFAMPDNKTDVPEVQEATK
jgi:hypothetical protein